MNKVRVAIVEDDEDDRDFIFTALQEKYNEADIMIFSTGGSFLEFIKTTETLPELIVTDLKMPVVSGFDVIQSIKNNPKTKDITIVVLSTSSSKADITKAKDLGAAGYYIKPNSFIEYSVITGMIMQVFNTGLLSFSRMKEEFLKTFYALLPVRVATQAEGL